jgi:hypothetical protein
MPSAVLVVPVSATTGTRAGRLLHNGFHDQAPFLRAECGELTGGPAGHYPSTPPAMERQRGHEDLDLSHRSCRQE